jgi:hypothetical protein
MEKMEISAVIITYNEEKIAFFRGNGQILLIRRILPTAKLNFHGFSP